MSNISNRGEQSTSAEIALLTALAALATSAAGEAIQKTGPASFANVTVGGGAISLETPTGTVDDSNMDFVFTEEPLLILFNGSIYPKNAGWTWAGSTATLFTPVGTGGFIRGIMT